MDWSLLSNGSIVVAISILAALLNIAGKGLYIADTLRGEVQPERASWWVWSLATFVSMMAQLDTGIGWSVGATLGRFAGMLAIAIISIKLGFGKFRRDHLVTLLLAAIGVAVWRITDNPVMTLMLMIVVDIAALSRTVSKLEKAPDSERALPWLLAMLSWILTIISLGPNLALDSVIYPAYLAASTGAMAYFTVLYRARSKALAPAVTNVAS